MQQEQTKNHQQQVLKNGKKVQAPPNLTRLFSKRLQFIKFSEGFKIDSKESFKSIAQNLESPNIMAELSKPILSDKMLQKIYEIFQSVIYRYLNEQNQNESYRQAKKKFNQQNRQSQKSINTYFQQKKSYVQNFYDLQLQEEIKLQNILNYFNISNLFKISWTYLSKIINTNFQFIKQGIFDFKKSKQLSTNLKISIYILIIDVLNMLNKAHFLCFQSVKNNQLLNKLNEKQNRLFQEECQQLKKLQIYGNLKIEIFEDKIQEIIQKIDRKQDNAVFQFWFSIYKVNKLFNLHQKTKYKNSPKLLQQIAIFWYNYKQNNHHLNQMIKQFMSKTLQKDKQKNVIGHKINFKNIFHQYQNHFRSIIKQLNQNNENKILLEVLKQYFTLIGQVWLNIDIQSSIQIYLQQLNFINQQMPKATFDNFIKKNRELIGEINEQVITQQFNIYKEYFLKQVLRKQIQTLFKNLLNSDQKQNFQNCLARWTEGMKKHLKLFKIQQKLPKNNIQNLEQDQFLLELEQNKLQTHLQTCSTKQLKNILSESRKTKQQDNQSNNQDNKFNIYLKVIKDFSNIFIQKTETKEKNAIQILQSLAKQLKIKNQNCYENLLQNIILNEKNKQLQESIDLVRFLMQMQNNMNQFNQSSKRRLEQCFMFFVKIIQTQNLNKNQKSIIAFFIVILQFLLQNSKEQNKYEKQIKNKSLKIKLQQYRYTKICKKINVVKEQYDQLLQKKIKVESQLNEYKQNKEGIRKIVNQLSQLFQKGKYSQGWKKLKQYNNYQFLQNFFKQYQYKNSTLRIAIQIVLFVKRQSGKNKNKNKNSENLLQKFINENKIWSKENSVKQKIINLFQSYDELQNFQKSADCPKEKQQKIIQNKNFNDQRIFKKEPSLKLIQGKVKIQDFYKNQVLKLKKYIVEFSNEQQYQNFIKSSLKLKQLNRCLTIVQNKQKKSVQVNVDQFEHYFENYPELVKHLIKEYLEIINFCKKKLGHKFYPLLDVSHIAINEQRTEHISYFLNPYEGIIMSMIIPEKDVLKSQVYKYPCFPFIHLADVIQQKLSDVSPHSKINTAIYYSFSHLIQQMKALSMQLIGDKRDDEMLKKRILKCPYFWSDKDKLFQIVQFKQRYQKMINIEQSRRKQNANAEKFNSEDPEYRRVQDLHRTAQAYFSIEGILQRQAYLQNIHNKPNFKKLSLNYGDENYHYQNYKYQTYYWIEQNKKNKKTNQNKDKQQIQTFLKIQAKSQVRRQTNKQGNFQEEQKMIEDAIYKMTFPSFQYHIRNLRNFSVHYLYDDDQNHEYDSEQKIQAFEKCYPKLFVFLYRWKPYVGKNYKSQIHTQQIKFLSEEVFPNKKPQNKSIIDKLKQIRELSPYNIQNKAYENRKNKLLKLFNYSWDKMAPPKNNQNQQDTGQDAESLPRGIRNKFSCWPCKVLCGAFNKPSFWAFLQDIRQRDNNQKEEDKFFNVMYWEHQYYKCNAHCNLIDAFRKTMTRQVVQTEELSELTQEQIKKMPKLYTSDQNSKKNKNQETKNQEIIEYSKYTQDQILLLMYDTDYVYKGFIFQLQSRFPYLFHDLRRYRYLWDVRATQLPKQIKQMIQNY